MKPWLKCLCLVLVAVLGFPFRSPAPFVYTPGEGITYEPVGTEGGKWQRSRAKDQLAVAQDAFDKKDYDLALKAAERVLQIFTFSDFAPQAEYLMGRCHEAKGKDEQAFKDYQKILEKFPKAANYQEIMERQLAIANRFLAGEHFLIWNTIPGFPSMEKTVALYEKIVKNGPFTDIAVKAQMNIGAAREKQSHFLNDNEPYIEAAKAYAVAADRYRDRPQVAADALFKEGEAYQKQAQRAEYDQSTAGKAIDTFRDFMTYFPKDSRVPQSEKYIALMKTEQARGNYQTALFYEKRHRWKGALIYYNEVLIQDPKSPYAAISLQRINALKKLTDNVNP